MNIFVDIHHFDLFYSLQLLCNKLGHTLYRPIGLEWYNQGYWKIGNDPEFLECLLSKDDGRCQEILNKYETLNEKDWAVFSLHLPRIGKIRESETGIYLIEDKSKGIVQNGITLDAFKQKKFDVIIATHPIHIDIYKKLNIENGNNAKLIFYVSAVNQINSGQINNIIINSNRHRPLGHYNINICNQQFDLNNFNYEPPNNSKIVRSYVHFPETEKLWNSINLDWDFKFIGKTLGPIKNIIVNQSDLAQEIKNSGFTLHIKRGAESFGHILFNSYAMGRPVIINKEDFDGRVDDWSDCAATKLLEDDSEGEICLDVDKYSPAQLREKLEYYSESNNHKKLCERVYKRFKEVVDFDLDAENMKIFLENLK